MLRLVQTSIDGKATRRRAKLSDFNSAAIPPPMIASALGKLRDLGLIVTTTEAGDAAIELASENLLQGWPRLKDWVDEHSENLLMRGEIETTTQTTGAAPLPPAMLDRIAAEWVSGTLKDVLNGRELEYILRSARVSGRIDLFETGETPVVARPAVVSRVFVAPELGKKAVKRLALSNLPERNQFFTGRETVLAQLQETLAERGRVALSGLGGVGKTQTAVEYAHRHLDEYVYTFWATAHSREALVSAYLTIASLLKLPECDAKDRALAVDAVKRWLSSQEGWLLILDNANDLGTAREFIPQGKNGHVILTTRARAVGAVARVVKIKTMDTEEGGLFLLRRAKYVAENAALDFASKADQANAIKIATQLDGLPLALDQAAAYIEETGCGLTDYLELYRQHASKLLRRRGEPASENSVASTWILSFENIEKANPAAAELLRFCAFLDPDVIPEELFAKGAPELGPVLGTIVRDALALDSVFSELSNYSLVRRDANAGTLEMHRLVQALLKQGMDEGTQRLWAERAVRVVDRAFPQVELSTWTLCERILPQAHASAELISQWGLEFPEAARLLNEAGVYLYERGHYTEAEFLCQRALDIREKALGPNHPDAATSLNNLALLYDAQGQYAKAEPLSRRALEIREKALGPNHPDVATSLNNLAELYRAQGQYAKAEPLYQRALAIWEKALGPNHPDVAISLNNLAKLYRAQSQYAEAESLCQRALEIREKALGPNHPDVATSLNNLAKLYRAQSQYAKAEPLYRRALEIQEKVLGPNHPDVATSLNNLAELYSAQGDYAKAEPLCQRALEIREKALVPNHPDVATSLNNLAELYSAQGHYAKAEPLYERALAIWEEALGPEHPKVATCLESYASLLRKSGRPVGEAEPLIRRALSIDKKSYGPEHPNVATGLNNLAQLLQNTNRLGEAEFLYQRALAIREKALGPEHPDVATSLENYAILLRNIDRAENARLLESRAKAIRRAGDSGGSRGSFH